MTFASSFSYLNNTIYGININANLDMRLENIPGAAGIAKVYFTDSSLPLNTSTALPPPALFNIVDSAGNNAAIQNLNGVVCYLIHQNMGYTMSLRGQVIFSLRTQVQECTITVPGITHFTI
ncbi:hypothetical protein RhiirA1_458627 [Rhizophagus irregularis]|uniref:Uncharacterized protein n=2 Tax=Rhizophagus irregularis TaxID=588596 RepID=A0A2I1EZM7_9GLOM|nr:hypothetical protein RhiirA1_458627 [Rhizophagus irregularis]PKY27580.1 hypothetical protein RhiirB3_443354 [Rhizophagus irregularis]CAB4473972.1 unnamed protein product [Rhizophagus irregularis]